MLADDDNAATERELEAPTEADLAAAAEEEEEADALLEDLRAVPEPTLDAVQSYLNEIGRCGC